MRLIFLSLSNKSIKTKIAPTAKCCEDEQRKFMLSSHSIHQVSSGESVSYPSTRISMFHQPPTLLEPVPMATLLNSSPSSSTSMENFPQTKHCNGCRENTTEEELRELTSLREIGARQLISMAHAERRGAGRELERYIPPECQGTPI